MMLKKKKRVLLVEEIHMYEDRPDVLFEKVRLNTLKTSPYRNSIIGTVKDIESITKRGLRDLLLYFL